MASSGAPPSRKPVSEARGQWKVISEVRRLVDEWRGFELGRASEPYANDPPRYEAVKDGESRLTETTLFPAPALVPS